MQFLEGSGKALTYVEPKDLTESVGIAVQGRDLFDFFEELFALFSRLSLCLFVCPSCAASRGKDFIFTSKRKELFALFLRGVVLKELTNVNLLLSSLDIQRNIHDTQIQFTLY